MRRLKNWLPLLVSGALIGWVVWAVSVEDLAQAFSEINWQLLVPLTVANVVLVYVYDGICLWWLFHDPERPLSYGAALHARGYSYLFTIFHYGLGQGLVAWLLSRAQKTSIASSGLRLVMMAYVDVCVLLSLGLLTSMAGFVPRTSDAPRTNDIAGIWAVGMAGLIGLTVLIRCVPAGFVMRLRKTKLGAWFGSWDWNGQRFLQLCALRLGYFSILMLYGLLALSVCDLRVDQWVLLSALPMVALANTLPSIAGLGPREAALVALIPTGHTEVLVAFSLIWSTCTIVVRGLIGLGHFWYSQLAASRLSHPPDERIASGDAPRARSNN